MGAVITFPQSPRVRQAASVREVGAAAALNEPTKPPPGRKGRGRASRA